MTADDMMTSSNRPSGASSRRAARQLVRHGHVQVNGERVDIPSYRVVPGEEVRVAPESRELVPVKVALEATPPELAADIVDLTDLPLVRLDAVVLAAVPRRLLRGGAREPMHGEHDGLATRAVPPTIARATASESAFASLSRSTCGPAKTLGRILLRSVLDEPSF